jgi:hypothetical protein
MRSTLAALAALLLGAAPAAAQEPEPPATQADTLRRADLPPAVADEVVAFFNDRRTLHFSGRTRIPQERSVTGDVAVLGGPLSVGGRVEGRVVVINGDVELSPGAVVDGDLTVIGGRVEGLEGARVGGEVRSYSEPLRYRHRGDRIVLAERGRPGDGVEPDSWGRATFLVTTGDSYNRVEGLPVLFGPVIRTAGSNPFRLRALAVYRTENGPFFRTERWGHDVSAEQFFGGRGELRVGGGVYSVVAPVEDWHVSDTENGLSTFLFHRDIRDHYERKGWNAYATVDPRGLPVSLTAGYRSERHRSLPTGDPWTVFDNGDPWRPQPLVAEGHLGSVYATAELDTRNDTRSPSIGWLVQGEVEHALDDDLVRPAGISTDLALPGGPPTVAVPAQAYGAFTRGLLDVRRYNRIDPESRLNLRLLVGGSLDGSPLPPQRQHALGGEGSLPGYSLFAFDCGARGGRVALPGDAASADPALFFTRYGCDRFALVQAEYRGNLSFRFNWSGGSWEDDEGRRYRESLNADVDWVLFADAGRGWASRGTIGGPTGVDAGFGLLFDELGVYAAVPLNGGSGVNLFARLGSRF